MKGLHLFLGFATEPAFDQELSRANPFLVSLMVGKKDYLLETHRNTSRYLGKYLDGYPSLEELEDLEKHLKSLVRKLVPCYSFESNPIVLLTVPLNE